MPPEQHKKPMTRKEFIKINLNILEALFFTYILTLIALGLACFIAYNDGCTSKAHLDIMRKGSGIVAVAWTIISITIYLYHLRKAIIKRKS